MENSNPKPDLDTKTIVIQAINDFVTQAVGPKERLIVPELESMSISDHNLLEAKQRIFDKIIHNFPLYLGKEISIKERHDKMLGSTSLTYGEIDFKGFAEIFYVIKKKYSSLLPSGGKFYDLGSGLGKGIIAAALVHDFEACIGIELLESLCEVSEKMNRAYEEVIKEQRKEKNISTEEKKDKDEEHAENNGNSDNAVEINAGQVDWDGKKFNHVPIVKTECGDILQKEWLDARLILINSTCFEPYLMWQISKKAKALPKDTLLVTITKRLPDYTNWEVLENYHSIMSWGDATIFIYRKITDPIHE